jgi:hypothetical protein
VSSLSFGRSTQSKPMRMRTIGIATSTLLCTVLLSFGWSEQGGVSLSVESAQARVGRPLTPVSVAGVARRHDRRAAYGYGYGAGVAGAAAVGTAAAVASSPYNGGWGSNNWSNSYAQLILTMDSLSTYTGPIMELALITVMPGGTITRRAAQLNALPAVRSSSTTVKPICASNS